MDFLDMHDNKKIRRLFGYLTDLKTNTYVQIHIFFENRLSNFYLIFWTRCIYKNTNK